MLSDGNKETHNIYLRALQVKYTLYKIKALSQSHLVPSQRICLYYSLHIQLLSRASKSDKIVSKVSLMSKIKLLQHSVPENPFCVCQLSRHPGFVVSF